MKDICAIVLAAGKGTRMNSDVPKMLHPILGKPMIRYVTDAVNSAGVKDIFVVVGHGKDEVSAAVKDIARVVVQRKLLGSGDAVTSAKNFLKRHKGDILVACGDTPLLKSDTLKALIAKHKASEASVTVLTAELDDAASYGRIIRDNLGRVTRITEKIEAGGAEENIREVNTGAYVFRSKDLFEALAKVRPNNRKKEIFLTDTIGILHSGGKPIASLVLSGIEEMIGINSRIDLARAAAIVKNEILDGLMAGGVTVEDPSSTVIYPGVRIGRDSVICANTVIESGVEIGARCHIGPMARIRGGVRISDEVEIGNFVELVRTTVGRSSRIKHHTYLGDTAVGRNVNIGAGTITANFDGKDKNKTVIGDGAFIGIGARLIAPLKIGKHSVVGAGSVVPKGHNVPDGATVVGVPARILRKGQS